MSQSSGAGNRGNAVLTLGCFIVLAFRFQDLVGQFKIIAQLSELPGLVLSAIFVRPVMKNDLGVVRGRVVYVGCHRKGDNTGMVLWKLFNIAHIRIILGHPTKPATTESLFGFALPFDLLRSASDATFDCLLFLTS